MPSRFGADGRGAQPMLWLRSRVLRLVAFLACVAAACAAFGAPAMASDFRTASRPPVDRIMRPDGLDRDYNAEFKRNWGLRATGAEAAYAAGATGRGIKVAIIDTGMDGASEDVQRNVSPNSIDLIGERTLNGARPHGAHIAAALAAARDGTGLVGVAPEATVLSVRADVDQPCRFSGCILSGPNIAEGIDYAVARGARVIILSLAGYRRLPSVEPAMLRAAQAGVVLVVAAGNQGRPQPGWPARYAADPAFGGMVVAVGASKRSGKIASYSNIAGKARSAYLVAPGDNIVVDCNRLGCQRASGTSYATAYVAGAIALLLDAFPHLDGREAVQLLLETARDAGANGIDAVYGRGHVSIARAFAAARAGEESQLVASEPIS